MLYAGQCPVCGEGLRGIRSCCGRCVALCDECDALWTSPDLVDRVSTSSGPTCANCHLSLWGDQAHWATTTEARAAGWLSRVQQIEQQASHTTTEADDSANEKANPIGHEFDSGGLLPAADNLQSGSNLLIFGLLIAGLALVGSLILR